MVKGSEVDCLLGYVCSYLSKESLLKASMYNIGHLPQVNDGEELLLFALLNYNLPMALTRLRLGSRIERDHTDEVCRAVRLQCNCVYMMEIIRIEETMLAGSWSSQHPASQQSNTINTTLDCARKDFVERQAVGGVYTVFGSFRRRYVREWP